MYTSLVPLLSNWPTTRLSQRFPPASSTSSDSSSQFLLLSMASRFYRLLLKNTLFAGACMHFSAQKFYMLGQWSPFRHRQHATVGSHATVEGECCFGVASCARWKSCHQIIMYIYHALINALSAHMIHINLNMIFYTYVEHSLTKTIYIKYYYIYIYIKYN